MMIDEKTLLLKQIAINQASILLYLAEIAKKNGMECLPALQKAIELNAQLHGGTISTSDGGDG